MFTLREATPADYDKMAAAVSLFEAADITGDVLRDRARHDEGFPWVYFVAVVEGQIVGFARAMHRFHDPAVRFWIATCVLPEWRGRGIGRALYDRVGQYALENGATYFESRIQEGDHHALEIIKRWGFEVTRNEFESVLNVASYVEPESEALLAKLASEGIRFQSYADAGESIEFLLQLHSINEETARDVPGTPQDANWPYDDFCREVVQSHWFRPQGQILAFDGEEAVGLAAVGETAPGVFSNMMTGVRRSYRGRGIAFALKILATRGAIQLGATEIRTGNDSSNQPMLKVNQALGYKRHRGWFWVRKDF